MTMSLANIAGDSDENDCILLAGVILWAQASKNKEPTFIKQFECEIMKAVAK
jgi:hypothetical protein